MRLALMTSSVRHQAHLLTGRLSISSQELQLNGNGFGDPGAVALFSAIGEANLPKLEMLMVAENAIGDEGAMALGAALAKGAMAKLSQLWLHSNRIGDAGLRALTSAMAPTTASDNGRPGAASSAMAPTTASDNGRPGAASGALAALTILGLADNRIGDAGVVALADACRQGALTELQSLSLGSKAGGNLIGDRGLAALVEVAAEDRGALRNVAVLGLVGNQIGDEGMRGLSRALHAGAFASLKRHLYLEGNPATEDARREALEGLERR
jgi:Ran GTPase-activating protein (RanGAP) involved in mRNA processing and transport